jgi:hypothetical protein
MPGDPGARLATCGIPTLWPHQRPVLVRAGAPPTRARQRVRHVRRSPRDEALQARAADRPWRRKLSGRDVAFALVAQGRSRAIHTVRRPKGQQTRHAPSWAAMESVGLPRRERARRVIGGCSRARSPEPGRAHHAAASPTAVAQSRTAISDRVSRQESGAAPAAARQARPAARTARAAPARPGSRRWLRASKLSARAVVRRRGGPAGRRSARSRPRQLAELASPRNANGSRSITLIGLTRPWRGRCAPPASESHPQGSQLRVR